MLLISVDGLHQSDTEWYVTNHPNSELAKLVHGGAEFTNAQTPVPSDSDPGGTALMTGGDPRATGVYYDVAYNHNVYEAGTTSCNGPTGGDVVYDSPDDLNVNRLDAGLVYAPGMVKHGSYGQSVETTQIAPTILALLRLNPQDLQAVQIEHTQVLPGLKDH